MIKPREKAWGLKSRAVPGFFMGSLCPIPATE